MRIVCGLYADHLQVAHKRPVTVIQNLHQLPLDSLELCGTASLNSLSLAFIFLHGNWFVVRLLINHANITTGIPYLRKYELLYFSARDPTSLSQLTKAT